MESKSSWLTASCAGATWNAMFLKGKRKLIKNK